MTALDFYCAERDRADRELAVAAARSRVLSRLRLVLMVLAVGTLLASGRLPRAVAWTVGGGAAIAFLVAVNRHAAARAVEREAWSRGRASREGIARIERDWAELPSVVPATDAGGWAERVARDLGVIGDRALMQLLGAPRSTLGASRIFRWLLDDPPAIQVLEQRQNSVRALRQHSGLLFEVGASAHRSAERPSTPRAIAAFVDWCEQPSAVSRGLITRTISVGLLALGVAGAFMRTDVGNALIAIAITGQLSMTAAARRRITARTKGTETAVSQLDGLVRISDVLVAAPDVDGRFGEIQRFMRGERITGTLRGLVRLLAWNDMRYSPLSHWMANVVVGFDVHLDAALENARAAHRSVARTWIEQLSDALALLSLATMAFEHSEWVVPEFDDASGAPPLDATSLAHPLLVPTTAKSNDARLLAPGATLVVSGPNMAGKTTYLRAIGVNVLLAQAGGVVSAERMRLARCRVRSSIRVEDDLGHGVSLFLAEILRARDIVVDAEKESAPRVMFLFDEILHGTNAEDRRLATRAVQERLQHAGAVGIVTTHDPLIATGASEHVHFDAEIGRDENGRPLLSFDYRATPGPAVRTNALALVELYLSSK